MNTTRLTAPLNLILLVTSLTLVTLNANAQDNEPKNSLQENVWALQFQITDNLSLRAFQGLAISAKKHFSNTSALRVGVGLNITVRDDDRLHRTLPADTLRQSYNDNSNTQSIDISSQYLLYANPDADINVFFGAGPLLRFTRNKVETEATNTMGSNSYTSKSVQNEHAWAVGASGLLGVEWFASRNISFLGEYALSFEYYTAHLTRTQTTTLSTNSTESEYNTKYFRVYPLSVRFGLSAYF